MLQHYTSVISGEDARSGLLRGIKTIADVVATTLGPRGRAVILADGSASGTTKVTKDGVSVARAINLSGLEGVGADLIKDASLRTNTMAGDGTTTSLILSGKLVNEMNKYALSGLGNLQLLQALNSAGVDCLQSLRKQSRAIESNKMLYSVATIAANNDPKIGKVVSDAFAAVGREGTITVEDGYTDIDTLNVTDGCSIPSGFLSPYFALGGSRYLELTNPLVVITDTVLSSAAPLVSILERCVKEKRPLLIIASDVTGDALSTLAINTLKGTVRCCAVRAPGYGDVKKGVLEDLAAVVGIPTYISDELHTASAPGSAVLSNIGSCHKAIITPANTVLHFNDDKNCNSLIRGRVAGLRSLLESNNLTNYQRSKLNERIGRLLGKVCTIRIGAKTELEAEEKKDRYIDSLSAARAALEGGLLPGGGVAFLRAAQVMERKLAEGKVADPVTIAAHKALIAALHEPARIIAESAGASGHVVAEAIKNSPDNFYGFDALNGQFVNMEKAGILDATKVVTTALDSALGVSSVLLNTDAVVQPIPTDTNLFKNK
ncbi:Chaperonin 60 [Giardia duodenalis]|uniref:Chaperonin 60 n=7 Tax=Giardia intestinalis TaxID=5741 RepID=E2RTS2_GIAIC|nr:Chaperonin 60 [Giardia intestinalis]AAC38821.1 chaperonin 60 [Giardia intestinalis]KAE8302004.1 Chaperonin 60 [Giardia intestinalis]|eukprot:XP_001705532.1 Chaperonin 60 [Giardia lamblia ATCC 50803]